MAVFKTTNFIVNVSVIHFFFTLLLPLAPSVTLDAIVTIDTSSSFIAMEKLGPKIMWEGYKLAQFWYQSIVILVSNDAAVIPFLLKHVPACMLEYWKCWIIRPQTMTILLYFELLNLSNTRAAQ